MWTTRKAQLELQLSSLSSLFDTSEVVIVSQGLGPSLALTVSRFELESGDSTGHSWRDNERNLRTLVMPPYYISDMQQALISIGEYERQSCNLYMRSLLKNANPIIAETFKAACRYVTSSKVSK